MINTLSKVLIGFLAAAMLFAIGCRKDSNFITGDAEVSYSRDTILFDTVFTELGSATRFVKIYNQEAEPIKVDVSLANPDGFFRMSADAFQGNDGTEVEILPGDSVYVFVEVTIDPDMPLSISPFVIEDDLLIKSGTRVDEVKLIAWGQNANYVPNRNAVGTVSLLSCDLQDVVWDDPKPYVIYGVLVIDSCNLVLPAGADVYVHGGIVRTTDGAVYNDGQVIVFPAGRITSQGTADEPVSIQGDRLESDFDDVPGQWGGIRLLSGSRGSVLKHTTIRNGIIGIFADSASQVTIDACRFENSTAGAIIGSHSEIKATNTLAYSAASSALQLVYGGTYEFDYCTFYSTTNQSATALLRNYRCPDFPLCQDGFFSNPIDVKINNSILIGPADDELILDDGTEVEGDFTYIMTNTIVKVSDLLDTDNVPDFFQNCDDCYNLMPMDTVFLDADQRDFRLDTVSVARDLGRPDSDVSMDIVDYLRDGSTPDVGCFEFQD